MTGRSVALSALAALVAGAPVYLAGVALIMYAPRTLG